MEMGCGVSPGWLVIGCSPSAPPSESVQSVTPRLPAWQVRGLAARLVRSKGSLSKGATTAKRAGQFRFALAIFAFWREKFPGSAEDSLPQGAQKNKEKQP